MRASRTPPGPRRCWAPGIVLLLPLLLGGCMLTPFDGETVGSRDDPIQFAGYMTEAEGEVTVQAFDFSSGAFADVATTRADGATYRFYDSSWTGWAVTRVLGRRFWTPGERGYRARIRARTGRWSALLVQEDWFACYLRHSDSLPAFSDHCRALGSAVDICTAGYLHPGSRRGPCPRRTVDVLTTDGSGVRTRLLLPDQTRSYVQERFDRFRWRGDGASFVDVFDASLATRDDDRILHSHGPLYANFVRVRYPQPSTSDTLASFDLATALAAAPLPAGATWRGGRTLRQYDTGECSLVTGWRQILDSWGNAFPTFAASLDAASSYALRVRPGPGRESLSPVLRTGETDAFHVFQPFDIDVHADADGGRGIYLGSISVEMAFTGSLSVNSRGLLVYTQEHFGLEFVRSGGLLLMLAESLGLTSLAEVEADMRERVGAALEGRLTGAFRSAVPPGVQIRRVHARPEGFEFVVAETPDDPQYSLVVSAAPGLCARPDPGPTATVTGLYTTIFEPPLSGDPPVFGD